MGLSLALPVDRPSYDNNAFFNIQVTRGDGGYGATISKQKVNLVQRTPYGELVKVADFVDHQPPFLALPEVRPVEPLPLPPAPVYTHNKKKL